MSAATLARAHGSRVVHLLAPDAPAPVTRCGQPARLMARWAPADARGHSKPRPVCERCRAA